MADEKEDEFEKLAKELHHRYCKLGCCAVDWNNIETDAQNFWMEQAKELKAQILEENQMPGLTDEELNLLAFGEEIIGDEITPTKAKEIRLNLHIKAQKELSRRQLLNKKD